MPNILLSRIKTPINLLVGVIFCIMIINNSPFYGKAIFVIVLILVNLISTKLQVKLLLQSWYRFRYLLLSIMLFNLYFTYPDYLLVLDKLFLILAMLALVNTYMQYEPKEKIANALASLLYPFELLGFNPKPAAILFITTLDRVEKMKQDISIKNFKFSETKTSGDSFELIASRLANYLQALESNEPEHS